MSTMTHRCPDCDHQVEHVEEDLCPSCGRCEIHCKHDTHKPMQRIGE